MPPNPRHCTFNLTGIKKLCKSKKSQNESDTKKKNCKNIIKCKKRFLNFLWFQFDQQVLPNAKCTVCVKYMENDSLCHDKKKGQNVIYYLSKKNKNPSSFGRQRNMLHVERKTSLIEYTPSLETPVFGSFFALSITNDTVRSLSIEPHKCINRLLYTFQHSIDQKQLLLWGQLVKHNWAKNTCCSGKPHRNAKQTVNWHIIHFTLVIIRHVGKKL